MSIDTIQQIWTKDSNSAIQIRASETILDNLMVGHMCVGGI